MTINDIKALIESVELPVYHAINKSEYPEDKYFVYKEDGDAGTTHADNKKHTRIFGGTIDLFTRADNDEAISKLEEALENSSIAWSYNSFQYEGDTEYYHHEWTWEVIFSG